MALHFAIRSSCRNSAPIFVSLLGVGKTSPAAINRSLVSASKALLAAPKAPSSLANSLRQFSATPIRRAAATGNHVTLWNAERALSVALLGVLPIGLMFPSQAGDALIAVSIVMHSHWGLEAIVTDYVRPILFGTMVPKMAHGMLLLVSACTLGGLFYFIHNDIGIANTVRKIWSTKSKA
ncbi:succinate dehydrogenase [ubiquinone] cytochrome b small subunit, mitochondrial [Uranotaenia lowii]|uniref:succinate dehydrogenase [ubiquinone] cytochrome b small subunit, mitochondrial n=1 Tax=Uranotaenia lowii TaxID=190385 RepID=UPI002479A295|nr:succinate dehydrogenase [ubiquinone] cytochrome b small subunit, mitochondrial [Uranotaenia lowii]